MYSSPVRHSPASYCYDPLPFDLHVLGLPPAFTLSQDQTLQLNLLPGTCAPDKTLERDLSYFDYSNYDSISPVKDSRFRGLGRS